MKNIINKKNCIINLKNIKHHKDLYSLRKDIENLGYQSKGADFYLYISAIKSKTSTAETWHICMHNPTMMNDKRIKQLLVEYLI